MNEMFAFEIAIAKLGRAPSDPPLQSPAPPGSLMRFALMPLGMILNMVWLLALLAPVSALQHGSARCYADRACEGMIRSYHIAIVTSFLEGFCSWQAITTALKRDSALKGRAPTRNPRVCRPTHATIELAFLGIIDYHGTKTGPRTEG